MNAESRDTFLRMILPAMLITIGYMFMFSRQSELDAALESLGAARAAAVDDFAVQVGRMQAAEKATELTTLEKEKSAMDERWTGLTSFSDSSPAKRTAALRQLTRMLWDRGLYPFEESPAASDGTLPASFDDVLSRLGRSTTANSQRRLWQIRFYGRYNDVVAALSSLGESNVELVPIGLTMSEANPDTAWRVWTLLLWN